MRPKTEDVSVRVSCFSGLAILLVDHGVQALVFWQVCAESGGHFVGFFEVVEPKNLVDLVVALVQDLIVADSLRSIGKYQDSETEPHIFLTYFCGADVVCVDEHSLHQVVADGLDPQKADPDFVLSFRNFFFIFEFYTHRNFIPIFLLSAYEYDSASFVANCVGIALEDDLIEPLLVGQLSHNGNHGVDVANFEVLDKDGRATHTLGILED